MQAPHLYKLLSDAADALGLQRHPQLFLHQSHQAALHYVELPISSRLPGLPASTNKARHPHTADGLSEALQHGTSGEIEPDRNLAPQTIVQIWKHVIKFIPIMVTMCSLYGLFEGCCWVHKSQRDMRQTITLHSFAHLESLACLCVCAAGPLNVLIVCVVIKFDWCAGDSESAAAVHQTAVVVTSRMIELLQPQELQAMFVGALSTGLMTGMHVSHVIFSIMHASSMARLLTHVVLF